MSIMKIIPAIDIIDGKCVRLTQGDYARKTVYNEDPVAVALSFQNAGLQYLHLVDLDGAKAGKVINWDVVQRITSATNMVVDFGGGIKTEDEIERLLSLGVGKVNLGSIAVKDPGLVKTWAKRFNVDQIILSADVKGENIAIGGWTEKSAITIDAFIDSYIEAGITQVTCTDISTDGMLSGPNLSLYQRLLAKHSTIRLTASGGVSSVTDLQRLSETGVDGVIIGKAIYEGRITLEELGSLKAQP